MAEGDEESGGVIACGRSKDINRVGGQILGVSKFQVVEVNGTQMSEILVSGTSCLAFKKLISSP